jgi:SET domain-containing protein
MEDFLDIDKVLRKTKDKTKLKVTLKHNQKGSSVYAKRQIKKGEVVLYYMFKLFNRDDYESPTNFDYAMKIYDKKDNIVRKYKGDIDETCMPKPKRGIPYWGVFANEPSPGEEDNVELNTNNKSNNKTKMKDGKHLTYKLVAIKDIKRGEEIMWGYGDSYPREYEVAATYSDSDDDSDSYEE